MKKKIIMLSAMLLLVTGMVSAQYCPPSNNGRSVYSTNSFNRGFAGLNAANLTLDRLAFSFSNIVNEGYSSGSLTNNEIARLERDYRNVEREIRWAYADGRLSFHERSMIDMYYRRLQRNISREWHDKDVRLG